MNSSANLGHAVPSGRPADKPVLLAWYSREDWPRVLAAMSDGPNFPGSYDDWTRLVEQAIDHARVRGAVVRKILLVPEEFLAWCGETGAKADSSSRVEYIRHLAEVEALMETTLASR